MAKLIYYLIVMSPQQIAEKMKSEIEQGSALTMQTLNQLKKYFDELKNSQPPVGTRPVETLGFKEKAIGYLLTSLMKNQHSSKDKIMILEILQRDLISSKHNVALFNKLYVYLIEEDENVAIQASKAIDALIKQINEGQQATANPTVLDTKQHYLKLFEFLKEKTEFLLRLADHVKDPEFKVYRRQSYEERDRQKEKDKEKEKKEVVFKNAKSLKFINQVPHLFIHLMAYVDTTNRPPEDDGKIKELIRKSIDNIIQSLRRTPYEDFYNEFNYDFNNELFGVMTKLLQFLFINLRSDKDQSGSTTKSNANLKKHIADQIEYIKVNEVIKNFIHLLKNCSEDFQLNRYEIVNRLKLLLNNLDKNKLVKNDALEIMGEILNQDTIFGKRRILGDYSKNAICSYWIEMIRSPVLLTHVFPQGLLSVRAVQQSTLNEDAPELVTCFQHIDRLVEQVLKTIFDNAFYPSVQEKCIELVTYLIDQLFPEGSDPASESAGGAGGVGSSGLARKVQENKLRILQRILDCASLKLSSIRHIFEEIDDFVTRKLGHRITKKELPQPLRLDHMQLNSLAPTVAESKDWQRSAVQFIENNTDDIDGSLLTVSVVQNKFITIYQQQDELCFNSHPVRMSNYTMYMREVKTKLLEKCITLAHKITKTFLSQNLDVYNAVQIASLKTIYFILSNKRALTPEQCRILSTILRNGLRIFEILHIYDLHSDEQVNKKGHLKNFMLIFAQIYDPVNFRDIFEPNMDEFFRNLINYAKNCADFCLQFVLIEPYCSNNNQTQPFNKNIVELLTYNLILRLESTSDQLDPFHEFYSYKQEYFLLLQKLIRFPFRCLSRYSDQSFIRNYFRQIILFLTKKAHTSRFCLDYLHLMRTLFKNILFNSNREAASPLFIEFYAICCRNAQQMQGQNTAHSIFINVNILDNFLRFYDTGIPQLADIVTELVIMLPLKSKHIIQFAKQGYIVKPLLHCLCLMSDYNYLLRTLKTFQIIISHSSAEEIAQFLDGVRDRLINRLFEMVSAEFKTNDLRPEKINNDLSSLSLKLLAKLGALSRNRDPPIALAPPLLAPEPHFMLVFERAGGLEGGLTAPLTSCIEYAIEVFLKLLDSYYQSIIFISMEMIEKSFDLLLSVLPLALAKMSPLAEKIINVFTAVLALSSKYLTISPTIQARIREQVKNEIKNHAENVKKELKTCGLTQYCRFFLRCLVLNLNERVLITREENFIKEISQQPKKFLWGLLLGVVEETRGFGSHSETVQFLIRLLVSSTVMLRNPHQIKLNPYQNDYNHILPFKNAALGALNELIDKAPPHILEETYPDVLEAVFISLSAIPDILNLKIMKHPRIIARKIFKYMLRDEEIFMQNFHTPRGERVFNCILQNLVGYSTQAHEIAKEFLNMIMDDTQLSLPELLYGGTKWEEVCDGNGLGSTQSKISLNDFSSWRESKRTETYPVVALLRNLLRIAHNVNEESLKYNPSTLKMLHNCFATYEMMIAIRWKGKFYQAFQMLAIPREDSDQAVGFNETFKKIITVAIQVINLNDKSYENFTKIIIEQSSGPNPAATAPPRPPQPQPQQQTAPRRDAPPPPAASQPPAPAPNNQSFNINMNTFIDDEEYGLNIEDLDMEIKSWGAVIGAILRFLKSVLLNENIFAASKIQMRKKNDKSKLTETRLEIIFRMFDLIGRVDKTVRETAYQCLKELLAKEDHPKDLIQNDEKLKHILRPVLISLQLDFKKFTPSFLHMFRKILKLLTQCFNITLIQKLVDKLREMEKTKELQAANQTKALPQQNPKHLNYSQITLQTKCIASFLALFQHLAYAYYNHRSANYTVNSIILIFKYVGNICNYFTPKLGRHTVRTHIKTTLARVLNTMCEKLSGDSIFVDGQERQLDLENFLELISLEESFPLREKLTRETSYIDKALGEFAKNKTKKDYVVFLEVILVLASRNSKWLRGFTTLGDRLIKELNEAVQVRYSARWDDKKEPESNEKNQVVLLSRVLLQFVRQNPQDLKALFSLVNVFKLRSTLDLHFIRKYLKYDLYQRAPPDIKRQIFMEFLGLLRGPQNGDSEKVIAISQNIIYYFILAEVNRPEEERQLLVADEELLRTFAETIKVCLNPRNLHNNKGLTQANFRQAANTYRIAIEVLQISNLALTALRNILSEINRNTMLLTVWGLLRIQDKIIKNYAFVWTSNYIRTFDGFEANKALGLYLTLIRGLQSLSQGDYEIGALIKKALNILIPYWDTRARTATSWIDWSLKAVHEQNNEPNKLVRFWEIVVKNHRIFHKFKSKFETQMVNSMQWLMVANNPTSTNPLVKKIASDMSFIYIEWKFKEAKAKLADAAPEARQHLLQDTLNDRAAEICLNFFIKVALNNSSDKDDKEIMKRSLYLLKKTLILWPNTRKKFDTIRTIVNKLKGTSSGAVSQGTEMPLRFHYTLLNIVHILLLYEQDQRLVSQLTSIFKLLELGGHIAPPRYTANTPHQPQPGTTIFTMNNIYLLNLLCGIVRRLVSVAVGSEREEESQKLLQEIHMYIRDGFEFHVLSGNRGKAGQPAQQVRPNQQLKKIEIQVAICFLKILYDIDPKCIDSHLNYIKQVTASLKKMFEKGFENSNKNNSPNRVYQLPPLTEGSFSEMLNKDLQIRVQLIRPEALLAAEDNYQKDNIKSYATRRPLFVILLRILAAKFNNIPHHEDQANILDIFLSIYERIPDPELKIEVINLLKCMFIGPSAFPGGVPERYKQISRIDYPVKKTFHLLFEDVSKFNEHFQRRKSKPSDQNYNINERIYQEITTKLYFNFLCQFIVSIPPSQLATAYLDKIKIFVLFAVKVADPELFDKILAILDHAYARSSLELCLNLFQDYRELNCTEENLQGDQIALFFTFYLYRRALQHSAVSVQAFGETLPVKFHDHYLSFLKSDLASPLHTEGLYATLSAAFKLLPESKNLSKILTEYLVNGSYNEGWGLIVLRVALERNCIQPEDLYKISCKINEYGLLLKHLERPQGNISSPMLDYTYRAYGDRDLVYGYRIATAHSPQLRAALLALQQRRHVDTLHHLSLLADDIESSSHKRGKGGEWAALADLKSKTDEGLINDMAKECFKNLNQWDSIIDSRTEDVASNADFLFHSSGNRERIASVIGELERLNSKQFSYYYGKSILNFLESTSSQNKQLNIALLFALLEWLSFPRNARHNQNRMLVKIQCLLQLQQGEKIKEESLTGTASQQPSLVDALTKVVQSVYTQINSWRQRMPDKSEDLTIWHSVLGQRVMIYDFMKSKMVHLLDSVVKNQNSFGSAISTATATEKLLIPYTDIEWNKLKLVKQQRYFRVFDHPLPTNPHNLYLDENLISHKENFYHALIHAQNHPQAIDILDAIAKDAKEASRDEELIKAQRQEVARLRGKVLTENGLYTEANALFMQAVRNNDQHLMPLWRDWLVLCLSAYQREKHVQWAELAIATLPYALRYKPHKTKLLLAPVFTLISAFQGSEQFASALMRITETVPIKPMMMWVPQLMRLAENEQRGNGGEEKPNPIFRILDKLTIYYTQAMYFSVKHLFRGAESAAAKAVFLDMKKIFYNFVTRVDGFAQSLIELSKTEKITVQSLGAFSRTIAQVHLPLYENWRGDLQPHHIPLIAQFSEELETETLNGKQYPVITLLGSDGKEYKYRLERSEPRERDPSLVEEFQAMLGSQALEMVNCHLRQWRESAVRKLELLEDRKLILFYNHEDARLARFNPHKRTPLDILHAYMKDHTSFEPDYPDSDRHVFHGDTQLLSLPGADRDVTINKRMKEIVGSDVLKRDLVNNTLSYDDFLTLRRSLSYQYGVLQCVNHLLGVPTELSKFMLDLRTGAVSVCQMAFNLDPERPSPFAVRFSSNFFELFGTTYINAGVLPAFLASADALTNPKLNFKAFLQLLYDELAKQRPTVNKEPIYHRVEDISRDYQRGVKIMELARKVGQDNSVPYTLKYWF